MAKRKRLDPLPLPADQAAAMPADLETKAMFPSYPLGVAPMRSAPIASVAADSATQAALEEVTQELTRARAEGRMILTLPLDAIDDSYLVRDRMAVDEDEMAALVDSIRARGQQVPVEVAELGPGRWGLISGWRRLLALRRIRVENPHADTVLAIRRRPSEAAEAYVAMVEENEIRANLSPYERARIVTRAADQGIWRDDRIAALGLFGHVSRPKRSRILDFVAIVRALDGALRFPAAMSEKQGVALAAALARDDGLAGRLRALLVTEPPQDAAAEAALIRRSLRPAVLPPVAMAPWTPPETSPETPPETVPQTSLSPAPLLLFGLRICLHDDGDSLRLTGSSASDPEFRARLIRWLDAEN